MRGAVALVLLIAVPAWAQGTNGVGGYSSPQNLNQPYSPSPPAKPLKSVALKDVANPTDTLSPASVEDSKGVSVGQVRRVVTNTKGQVTRVDVLLKTQNTPGRVVSFKPASLRYIPASSLLHSNMTAAEINALPAASGG